MVLYPSEYAVNLYACVSVFFNCFSELLKSFILFRRKPRRYGKRCRITRTEEYPYPNILPIPRNQPDAAAFRTRLLQLARHQKATVHHEQEKTLKRRHSISSFSRLPTSDAKRLQAVPELRRAGVAREQCQQRALSDAQQLLRTLERQPSTPIRKSTPSKHQATSEIPSKSLPEQPRQRPSSASSAHKVKSSALTSSFSHVTTRSTPKQPLLRSRSASCISLSVAQFGSQQAIKTRKVKRPQSASCRSSRQLKHHEQQASGDHADTWSNKKKKIGQFLPSNQEISQLSSFFLITSNQTKDSTVIFFVKISLRSHTFPINFWSYPINNQIIIHYCIVTKFQTDNYFSRSNQSYPLRTVGNDHNYNSFTANLMTFTMPWETVYRTSSPLRKNGVLHCAQKR